MIALPWPRRRPRKPSTEPVKTVKFIKGCETYLFFYLAGQETEVLRSFGRHASDRDLSFTWYDAAVLGNEIRKARKRHEQRSRQPRHW